MPGEEEGVYDSQDGVGPQACLLVVSHAAHVERVKFKLVSYGRELCAERRSREQLNDRFILVKSGKLSGIELIRAYLHM